MANEQNLKPFQPGQSGNPAGKLPGTRHLSTLLREALASGVDVEVDGKPITVDMQETIKQVARGIAKGNIKFIEMAFDRIDGKALQSVELTGEDGGPIQHTVRGKWIIEDHTGGQEPPPLDE